MSGVQQAWETIVAWYKRHDIPSEDFCLAEGATEEQLAAAEEQLGLALPADVRASYLLHDGSVGKAVSPRGYHLMSLDEMIEFTQLWRGPLADGLFDDTSTSPEGPIQPVMWNAKWITLTSNGAGDHQCLDLDPAPGGQVGQIIDFSHVFGPTRVLAGSLEEWLTRFAAALESGVFRYDPSSLALVSATPVGEAMSDVGGLGPESSAVEETTEVGGEG